MSLTSAEDISITSVQGAVRLEAGVTMDTVMLPHGGVQGYQVRDRIPFSFEIWLASKAVKIILIYSILLDRGADANRHAEYGRLSS